MVEKIEVFICYAHKDEGLMRELVSQLSVLEKRGLITIWHDRMIMGGKDWKQEVNKHLDSARIILLLVSADFMFSEYSTIEVKRAMERYNAGEAEVIPVILRYVSWRGSSFGELTPFPKDGKPVTSFASRDQPLFEVVEGVENAVKELRKPVLPLEKPDSSDTIQSSSHKEQPPMTQHAKDEEFHVFLCYNSKDEVEVRGIAVQLRGKGIRPWFDKWELRPGTSWQDALQKQIGQINTVAVFVGKDGVGPWQNQELNAYIRKFVNMGSQVIPVLLGDASQKPTLPVFLEGLQYVDFRKPETEPMKHLIWGITGEKPDDGAEVPGGGRGAPAKYSDANIVTPKITTLSRQQRTELVDKLLTCPAMRDRQTRDIIVQALSFAAAISRHAADRVDVTNIVNTSLNYQDGLQDLVEEIGTFEGNSLPMQQLRAFAGSLS